MTILTYPVDLPYKYYLSINFSKYVRPDPFSSLTTLVPVGDTKGLESTIYLPIPSNLKNSLDLNWTAEPVGPAGEYAAAWATGDDVGKKGALTLAAIQAGPAAIGTVVGAIAGITGSPYIAGAAQNAAESTAAAVSKSILQTAGLAMNPVLTQMFNNPNFKQHNFSWKFAPDSAEESTRLRNIIRTLDFNSKPSAEQGGVFFGYPSVATITIKNGDNNSLYKIQTSVVQNLTVNYAPNGVPAFFGRTNEPVMVQIDVTFLEIILNTRNNSVDIGGSDLEINPLGLGILGLFNNITNAVGDAVNKDNRNEKATIDAAQAAADSRNSSSAPIPNRTNGR